jgi:hypothetical protein
MRRLVEQTREATRGGTGSNSSMRLVVQRYWRKLANPGALRDHGRHPKSSGTSVSKRRLCGPATSDGRQARGTTGYRPKAADHM